MKLGVKSLSFKELRLLDLVMTGEAARICGVDRRTFLLRVERGEIKEVTKIDGKAVFKRDDVSRLAKKLKAEKEAKSNR